MHHTGMNKRKSTHNGESTLLFEDLDEAKINIMCIVVIPFAQMMK
jgi:hypothetical protein